MTEHYVTLFDAPFLPQGLALHSSLLQHGDEFILWILCLDVECLHTLQHLDLPRIRLLDLQNLETSDLLAVKPERTRAEYCWTLTPWSIQWVFEADATALRVTYLDADVFFLKPPINILNEFKASGKDVLITEHCYAPEHDQTPTSGRFCVQFLSVVRGHGELVLFWWRDRCLEWCFARFENGKFGDQKYLESFSDEFPGSVCEISSDSRLQGPWNASIFRFSDAVLYHFHGLRLFSMSTALVSYYPLTQPLINHIYIPYIRCIYSLLSRYAIPSAAQAVPPGFKQILSLKLKKKILSTVSGATRPPFYACYRDGDVVIW